ncbi:hypothetical protein EV186_106182 [Labedaea rhizosphaerae]|uniref:Uncharacterized protein n=2 Tax=Labedaea rhizosphaerae TaxID=598644 RepID=A0A4V3CYE0_LABRH|nr:hypothetical protein EV186_106182 [Labedaea rhizosphaerae]
MTYTEELIVAALRTQAEGTQADRRPDAMAIRDVLTRQGRRIRRNVVIAVVAAAVAAITVPVVLHRAPGGTAAPAAPAAQVVPAAPAAKPSAPVTEMNLAPHWLPAHVVEAERTSTSQSFTRTWLDGEVDDGGTPVAISGVSLAVGPGHLPAKGKSLTVNGKPAKELTGENDTRVVWEQSPGRLVTVSALLGPDEAQAGIAERVARSVRQGDTVRFAPQLRFDHLPAGWTAAGAKVFGSRHVNPPKTRISAKTTYQGHEFVLTFGQLRTGKPGLAQVERDGYDVAVAGTEQTGHLPGWPDFTALLAAVQVDQHADVSWIGTR